MSIGQHKFQPFLYNNFASSYAFLMMQSSLLLGEMCTYLVLFLSLFSCIQTFRVNAIT